jgi:hypothetical protein
MKRGMMVRADIDKPSEYLTCCILSRVDHVNLQPSRLPLDNDINRVIGVALLRLLWTTAERAPFHLVADRPVGRGSDSQSDIQDNTVVVGGLFVKMVQAVSHCAGNLIAGDTNEVSCDDVERRYCVRCNFSGLIKR